MSSELWEALNLTFLRIDEQTRRARRTGPHLFFQWVRERTALVAGITDSTMSRDEGWMFLVLGRSIERVDMMARLMITTRAMNRVRPPELADPAALLRRIRGLPADLPGPGVRTHRGRVPVARPAVPAFDVRGPVHRRGCLRQLDTGEGRLGSTDAAHRLLGRARTGLEYRGVDEMLADLTEQLEAIQEACAEATLSLGTRYFPHTVTVLGR